MRFPHKREYKIPRIVIVLLGWVESGGLLVVDLLLLIPLCFLCGNGCCGLIIRETGRGGRFPYLLR